MSTRTEAALTKLKKGRQVIKHTPEPWVLEIGEHACFHKGNRVSIVKIYDPPHELSLGDDEAGIETVAEVWPTAGDSDIEDGKRIVACVNACQGIPDPETTVPELVVALKNMTASARTFRNVPQEEQAWTQFDDDALDAAFALLSKLEGSAE